MNVPMQLFNQGFRYTRKCHIRPKLDFGLRRIPQSSHNNGLIKLLRCESGQSQPAGIWQEVEDDNNIHLTPATSSETSTKGFEILLKYRLLRP